MTGPSLGIYNGYGRVQASDTNVALQIFGGDPTDSSNVYNFRLFQILSLSYESNLKNAFRVRDYTVSDGKSHWYLLFGEHNKTISTYKGNSSATTRTIDTGSVGSVCVIHSSYGMAIVTPYGAICKTASGTSTAGLATSGCKFSNGVLTIASTSGYVNSSSYTYTIQVL